MSYSEDIRGAGIASMRMVLVDTPGLDENTSVGKCEVCNGNACMLW